MQYVSKAQQQLGVARVEQDQAVPPPSASPEGTLASEKASDKKATKSAKKLAKEQRRLDKRRAKEEAKALALRDEETEALDTFLKDLASAPASE